MSARLWIVACAGVLLLLGCSGIDTLAAGDRYVAVSVGAEHACALTNADQILCWGQNGADQVDGQGGQIISTPWPVFLGPLRAGRVVAGAGQSCAELQGGGALCWGDGVAAPRVVGTASVRSVALGQFGCLLNEDGGVQCWEAPGDSLTTVALPGPATEVAAGGNAACALLAADAGVTCWTGISGAPVAQPGTAGLGLRALTRGDGHTCAIGADSLARCWGANASGQVGDGSTSAAIVPAIVTRGDRLVGDHFVTIHAGGDRTCGATVQHGGFCWGAGGYGSSPRLIASVELYYDVMPGVGHACGVSSFDDVLYCFGTNTSGQLGDGTTEVRDLPVRVLGP